MYRRQLPGSRLDVGGEIFRLRRRQGWEVLPAVRELCGGHRRGRGAERATGNREKGRDCLASDLGFRHAAPAGPPGQGAGQLPREAKGKVLIHVTQCNTQAGPGKIVRRIISPPGRSPLPGVTQLLFGVTAESVLRLVAGLLAKHRLDAVLIGNAAAALRGSPVTTVDLDFMFRKTPGDLRKVRRLADDLDAVVFLPYYPASELYRVVRDRDGLQLDFMAKIDGIRSFEGLRARATAARFGKHELLVAALEDIIRSKQAANRPQDRAVLPVLRRTLREAR